MNYRQLVIRLTQILDKNKIPYMIVGGLAVNIHGMLRATFDLDLAVMLKKEKVEALVEQLQQIGFDIKKGDVETILQIGNRFFTYHPEIPHRIDFWIPKTEFDLQAFKRRKKMKIFGKTMWLISPENLILAKLLAGRGKDQDDVIGILKRKAGKLNEKYLNDWAKQMNVVKELERLKKI